MERERLEHATLLAVEGGQDRTDARWRGRRGRVEDVDLMDFGQAIHHPDDAQLDASLGELAAKQAEDHEGKDAVERMDPELLIGPVESRPEGEKARVLHSPERCLYVRLAAVGKHDLLVAPGVLVGEEQSLPEQGAAQLQAAPGPELLTPEGRAWGFVRGG